MVLDFLFWFRVLARAKTSFLGQRVDQDAAMVEREDF